MNSPDGSYPMTPDSGVSEAMMELSEEERAKQEEEWKKELAKTEDEIMTLRQVVASKMRHAQELKRKLGITPWRELTDDMSQGIQNIRETPAYQKTSAAVKTTAEKTTSLLGGLGTSISAKFGAVKESGTFKTIEEKMGTAYSSVRTKISSRSNSTQSFDEALREAEAQQQQQQATAGQETTPTNPVPEPTTTS